MASDQISALTPGRIKQLLEPYNISPDEELCTMIQDYVAVLLRWNAKVSLTAITVPEEIVRIHFGESIFAATEACIDKGRLADIGTGAGFPGIPIRMVRPRISLTLIESNAKKCAFLGEVIRRLRLDSVDIIRSRMEQIGDSQIHPFNFVASRALGNYEAILHWARVHLSSSGSVIFLLGAVDAQALATAPGWYWNPPVKIPGSRSRFVLKGAKGST